MSDTGTSQSGEAKTFSRAEMMEIVAEISFLKDNGYFGKPPPPPPPPVEPLGGGPHDPGMEPRVAALEADMKDVKAGIGRLEVSLAETTATLSGRIDTLSETLSGRIDTVSESLSGRINTLSETLSGRIDTVSEMLSGRIGTLSGRIDTVSEMLSGRIDTVSETLSGRIDTLTERLHAHGETLTDVKHAIRDLGSKVDAKLISGGQMFGIFLGLLTAFFAFGGIAIGALKYFGLLH